MRNFDVLCDALAAVLIYPERDYAERVMRCRDVAAVEAPAALEQIEALMANIEGKSLSELEEGYIQTFDLNPLCSLDTGWQLFGEEYNRGLYMVRLRNEMRRLDIPETTELPDHLTNALRVLGRMSEEDAISFAVCCLVPAVDKLLGAVKKGNAYRPLIQGIANLLEERYGRHVEELADADSFDHSGELAVKETNHD